MLSRWTLQGRDAQQKEQNGQRHCTAALEKTEREGNGTQKDGWERDSGVPCTPHLTVWALFRGQLAIIHHFRQKAIGSVIAF